MFSIPHVVSLFTKPELFFWCLSTLRRSTACTSQVDFISLLLNFESFLENTLKK